MRALIAGIAAAAVAPSVGEAEAAAAKSKTTLDSQTALLNGADFTNLFNAATITNGVALPAHGGTPTANAAFYTSDYFPVEAGATYARAATAAGKYFAFYDANLIYLSTQLVAAATTTVVAPAAAAYCRTTARLDESPAASFMIIKAAALPASYVPWVGRSIERKSSRNIAGGYVGIDASGRVPASLIPTLASTPNLYQPTTVTPNVALEANSGNAVANLNFYTTDFIAVVPGTAYTFSTPSGGKYVAFYNGSKAYIASSTIISTGSFVAPAGAAFAKISARYSDTAVHRFALVAGSTLPFRADSLLAGKTIAGLGDSITYGFIPRNAPGYPGQLPSWLAIMAADLGAAALNYGISGSTVSSGTGASNAMVDRYSAMSDAADVVLVMGGTNDARNGIPLGAMGDTTGATFFGALDVLCQGLLNKYRYASTSQGPAKKIAFATAIRLLDPATGGLRANLLSFNDATKQVCDKYCIPVFDAYNRSTLTPDLFRTLQGTESGYTGMYNPYMTDGTHPTREGQIILAQAFSGFVRGLY